MTYLFTNIRLGVYGFQGLLAGVVLGLSGYFGSIFLPHLYAEYTIYSLAVASLTLVMIILFLTLSHIMEPRVEIIILFILSVLWLALGAWTVDRRDFLSDASDCAGWGDAKMSTKSDTVTISRLQYCNRMRVIEAFSWVLFGVFAIFFIIVLHLTSIAVQRGMRPYAWREPMIELPWYGEWPGYSGGYNSAYPTMHMAGGGMVPGGYYQGGVVPHHGPISTLPVMQNGGYVVQQQPGHSMIITPSADGRAPDVQQVFGHVA